MSARPFKLGESNFQCHQCGGWGHGWQECAMKGNIDWVRIHGGSEPKEKRDRPRKRSTVNRDVTALKELYHNPEPLVRLIGEANETNIIIENEKVKGLIDSRA